MKTFILFVYLSSYSAQGGMTVTSAEFSSKTACLAASIEIVKEFKTTFTQTPKVLCLEK